MGMISFLALKGNYINRICEYKCIKKFCNCLFVILYSLTIQGARGSLVVKALSYEPEGRGFETR
jgi:hypothetical protein